MNEKVFCLDCKRYFNNNKEWDEEHNKLYYKVNNIKHKFLIENNVLSYISDIMSKNFENAQKINILNLEIVKIKSKLNFYEDSLKNDVFFETNMKQKDIDNKIFGKCLIHFFPKTINFKIECNELIKFDGKKDLELEILFPFQICEFKFCSIEKLQGCVLSKKVKNMSDDETSIISNYSSIVNQRNKIISINLLRNYCISENLPKNKLNISLNGTLTFSDFGLNFNKSFVLYNTNQKKFLFYSNNQWKFVENCFSQDGNIIKECIVDIELNFELNEIYIKNKYKYLKNENNFVTQEKQNAKFLFQFLNSFYGIIAIISNNKYLDANISTGLVELSEISNYFMMINV